MIGRRHKLGPPVGAALAIVCWASLAFGAAPVKNARYSGALKGLSTEKVSFKVTRGGGKVLRFKVAPFFPNACGSGGTPPTYRSTRASISRGRFEMKVWVITRHGNRVPAGKAKGRFLSNGRERGTVTPVGLPKHCIKPFPYTTKASG